MPKTCAVSRILRTAGDLVSEPGARGGMCCHILKAADILSTPKDAEMYAAAFVKNLYKKDSPHCREAYWYALPDTQMESRAIALYLAADLWSDPTFKLSKT
jgi:hypothetical protein